MASGTPSGRAEALQTCRHADVADMVAGLSLDLFLSFPAGTASGTPETALKLAESRTWTPSGRAEALTVAGTLRVRCGYVRYMRTVLCRLIHVPVSLPSLFFLQGKGRKGRILRPHVPARQGRDKADRATRISLKTCVRTYRTYPHDPRTA